MHSHPAVAKARFNPIAIAALSWRDFERLIGETFRGRGFQVTGFGSRGADGAADLALVKTGERFLVQCKHWRKHEVGVLAVRELSTALDAVGAQGGYVLTAGEFTPEAREFARRARIELIGGRALIAWLRGGGRRERRARLDKVRNSMINNGLKELRRGTKPTRARASSTIAAGSR
jgi:restriction system protein